MEPERFREAERLFLRALELGPEERAGLLEEVSARDPGLARVVERLLARDPGPVAPDERMELVPGAGRDPYVGRMLGNWRLTSRLASGGMGVVYRASRADGLFEQEVAVKLLRVEAAAPEALRRFALERQLLARLDHPNIARLLDGGTTEHGTPYLVMELVDGERIDRWCEEQRLSLEARLRVFATVCHAVHFAHQSLVVHRDLKPSNVFVDGHGNPKLLDFGIARIVSESESLPTLTAARLLTPQYASPEQLKGLPLTTATDVYSLGVVLYELLAGRRPWSDTGRTAGEWERIVSERTPTRPSTAVLQGSGKEDGREPQEFAAQFGTTPARLGRRLRGDLDRIVLMALRKEPERRYASAEQLAEDLERFLAGRPVRARPDTLVYRTQRFAHRNRVAVAAAALVLLALCGVVLASWRGRLRAEEAAEHARIEADSFRLIAQFLGDTFLSSTALAEERERVGRSVDRHAERVRRQYAGSPHLRANLLDALGMDVCLRLDLFEGAEELLREAHAIRVRTFGERSLETALSLTSLGRLHHARGEHAQAAEAFAAALELHRNLPADVHSDVALVANDLAVAERSLGRQEAARRLHEEALALRRAALPAGLPVAESLNNLALVLLDLGELDAAEAQLREALEHRVRLLGADHPLSLQTLANFAGVEWKRGELDRAAELLGEAEEGFRRLGAEGREGLLRTLSSVASVHVARGDLAAAEVAAEEALALARGSLGPDHPQVALVLTRLAAVHARTGELERARAEWEDVLRIQRGAYPPGHPLLASSLASYAGFLLHAALSPAEAEGPLREALEIHGRLAPPDALGRAYVELLLGTSLARLGRPEEARPLLEAALACFERTKGLDSDEARAARERLDALG